jgi:TonB family protein
MRSAAAWEEVQAELKTLGFTVDQTDRHNQVLLTKWRDVGSKGLSWLPELQLADHFKPNRIRFVVFVSPFAEPARVAVGSLVEATAFGPSPRRANVYNPAVANRALMGELARALGQPGVPIPATVEGRRQLELAFLKDAAGPCVRQIEIPGGGKTVAPYKIPLSYFEVVYPRDAAWERTEGVVHVQFQALEDGTISDLRLISRTPDQSLSNSALGAASLLLYAPATLNGCPMPVGVTYTVKYSLR